jgi:hypothetical protein
VRRARSCTWTVGCWAPTAGITDYTIGQRRGLNVAVGEPLFVTKLDPAKRHVIVGPREALLTAVPDAGRDQLAGRRNRHRGGRRGRRAGAGPRPLDPSAVARPDWR